eukprot:gb/GEZN01008051.1/.p1 GENE.gb/GEZN01008051.1/~~gb/GEZN01008051.1/.p1  ORF type:complete len:355 (+),score=26.61 gb/GEZN01008051.1/:78-1142(+)
MEKQGEDDTLVPYELLGDSNIFLKAELWDFLRSRLLLMMLLAPILFVTPYLISALRVLQPVVVDTASEFSRTFSVNGQDVRVSMTSRGNSMGKSSMKDSNDEDISFEVKAGVFTANVNVIKDGPNSGHLTIQYSKGATLTPALKGLMTATKASLASHGQGASKRVGIVGQFMEYLEAGPDQHPLVDLDTDIIIHVIDDYGYDDKAPAEESDPADVSAAPASDRRRVLAGCFPPVKYPNSNEPSCPYASSVKEKDDGALCMCPYGGGSIWTASYDIDAGDYSWGRYHGSDSNQCTGRCGAGCSVMDQQAFQDCFDHDSCVDHVGGSALRGNPDCGNEFDHAADDYLASYGFRCCR